MPDPEFDDLDPDQEDMAEDPGMDKTEFQSIVRDEIEDAISFIDTDIAPIRRDATLYYKGTLFGDEEPGRSKVVSRDVHDVVKGILPSLMRVFFGPEKVVEFAPDGEEDVAMAEQATDYVNYIVTRDNPGFSVFWDAFKDALIRKCGIVRYDWDDSITVTRQSYSGLDPMAYQLLKQHLGESIDEFEPQNETQDENGVSVSIKLKKKADRAIIASVPPEEFLIDRRARSDEHFTFIGQRRELTRSELVAMGYTDAELDNLGSDDGELSQNLERQAREITTQLVATDGTGGFSGDESQNRILYVEGYIRADKDGDGIAELRKVCAAGAAFKILHEEQVEDHCFAIFPSDPEPHTFFGDCPAEQVMDIQKNKSGVLRASLDSLALSIHPRTAVGPGVNMADVLNTEIGAIVRTTNVANVVPLITPFVGKDAFPMLAYMDEVRESRTGMSKTAMGLEPGALQNMTALAAASQFNKAHEHVEIIARIFAETGMKRLFRGLLRLVTENQRKARLINLRNQWVPVDPRAWKANMDVTCNVALGAGTNKEKIATLMGVKQTQEQIILTAGPNNPLSGLGEYHNTLTEILALSGFKNSTKYFKDPATQPPTPQAPPPPDPKIVAAQIASQDKAADRQQAFALGMLEIQAKYRTTIDAEQMQQVTDFARMHTDLVIQASEAHHERHMQAVDAGHQERMAKHKAATGDANAG